MLILASSSRSFSEKWKKILGKTEKLRHVATVDELKTILNQEDVSLIVLDLTMDGCRQADVLRFISERKKQARLILSGIQFKPSEELFGLTVGAVACCSLSFSVEECQKILNVVKHGGVWLSNAGIPELVSQLQGLSKKNTPEKTSEESKPSEDLSQILTKREMEVARLVSGGASNKDIARQLDISDRTVKAHLTAIFAKLNIQDRLQLALRVSNQPAS